MQFKQAQIDKYLKKPDDVLRCAVIYGSNEGLQAEYVKKFTTAVCPDPYDPFRVVYLNGSDINSDPGILFGEYNGQSLMGGRRVVIVRDGDNNLTKHVKALLENNVSDTLLIVSSGSLNKKSSLVRRQSPAMKIVMKIFSTQPAPSLSKTGLLSATRRCSFYARGFPMTG